ncbi:AP-4 complex subunit sigma-like isoform X2 [Primulina tabacum]|uniref:AP-4 complex subunit sigma-like isoform X2 n=1 Tax=Primulina tabacum TaxID=48773 RepID=UPI003F5A0ADA
MGIRFVLMVNKQGQTRLAQYYEYLTLEERRALEGEIVRKCLVRTEQQCAFVKHRNYEIVYRRYASLFFLVGVDNEEVQVPSSINEALNEPKWKAVVFDDIKALEKNKTWHIANSAKTQPALDSSTTLDSK